MGRTADTRSDLHRSLVRALVVIGGAGVGLAVVFLGVSLPSVSIEAVPWAFMVVFGMYLAAGIIAWAQRPTNGMGPLIVFAGFTVYAGSLFEPDSAILQTIGIIFATTVLAAIVHLLLAFPSGSLHGRLERLVVAAAYVVAIVLQTPLYLTAPGPWGPALVDAPWLGAAGAVVQTGVGLIVMGVTAWILAGRLRRADRAHRRVLLPLFSYSIVAILVVPTAPYIFRPLGLPEEARLFVQLAIIAGVPVAFATGVLRGGFARTRALEELAMRIGSGPLDAEGIERAVADMLGDNSVRLGYRLSDESSLVGADGTPLAPQPPGVDRAVVDIVRNGQEIAKIFYDPRLTAREADARRAGGIVAVALERERLTAQLRATEKELRRSRRRIVTASDDERRRIARDLHDGIQVQLVLLAAEADALAIAAPADSASRDGAQRLQLGLDRASDELRGLVHAVMPATLVERGLATALEDLVDRMPIPTTVDIENQFRPLPAAVESTAYFVVAEVLTNAVRHARAHRAAVRVSVGEDVLRVVVEDDGAGGALRGGSGLRGIADRVDALDGTFDLISPRGAGTRIKVELPCGS